MEWCTIESDPGVFHEMISRLGVKDVEVKELWSLDTESMRAIDAYGYVFLFKWQKEATRENQALEPHAPPNVWFSRQLINNACATIAMLNCLMNAPNVDLGTELTAFRDFTADMDEEMKGEVLSNSEPIRNVHNSFAKPEPMITEEDKDDRTGEAFHFITFIPSEGRAIELDGLKPSPIAHGPTSTDKLAWIDTVQKVLSERISRYEASEVRFTLLAICGDSLAAATNRMKELESMMEDETVQFQRESLIETIEEETAKRSRWTTENIRRRHNFLPLLANTLEFLTEHNELGPLIERAKELTRSKANA